MTLLSLGSPPEPVSGRKLRKDAAGCSLLILAAGFEDRVLRVVDLLGDALPERIVVVTYAEGLHENDQNRDAIRARVAGQKSRSEVVFVQLDSRSANGFEVELEEILQRWKPDATGDVWVDISGLSMRGICSCLAVTREVLRGCSTRILYTEAETYFPSKSQVSVGEEKPLAALSREMAANVIPPRFRGSSNEEASCLIVFAGYEKHRSYGVVDQINPSRLVLIYGSPYRAELKWRETWSRKLHQKLAASRPTAEELVSTLDASKALELLEDYYGFLYPDHNIAVAAICSKMQAVACYLLWERHRDVQIVFPVPVAYFPAQFTQGFRETFSLTIPASALFNRVREAISE